MQVDKHNENGSTLRSKTYLKSAATKKHWNSSITIRTCTDSTYKIPWFSGLFAKKNSNRMIITMQ